MDSKMQFTSLSSLIESHLSKTIIAAEKLENNENGRQQFHLPKLKTMCGNTQSESNIGNAPRTKFIIPKLGNKNGVSTTNSIEKLLATMQLNSNKDIQTNVETICEKPVVKETEPIKDESDSDDDCIIDLRTALTQPGQIYVKPQVESSPDEDSCIEHFNSLFIDCDPEAVPPVVEDEQTVQLLCTMDISDILTRSLKQKCSSAGKVLSSRLRTLPAPYIRHNVSIRNDKIKIFTFSTPSPDDEIKAVLFLTKGIK